MNPYQSPKSEDLDSRGVESPWGEVLSFTCGMGIGALMCAIVYSTALFITTFGK